MHALALGCYALLALVTTYPLIRYFDSHIIANQYGAVDGYLSIWNIWWAAQALQSGQNPFISSLLFYPQGIDIFWLNQASSLPQGLLVFPLTVTVGPLVAYNTVMLASFVLGGYTAFLFVRHFVPNNLAAFIAGMIFIFSPFHLQEVLDAVVDTAAIQWVPLYLLVFHLLLERHRWYWAVLAGMLLVWVGWGSWYYCLFCLIYSGAATLLWSIRKSDQSAIWWGAFTRRVSIRILLWGSAPVFLWLALMTPRLLLLIETGDTLLGDARAFNEASSADLVTFFLPSPLHPLWGTAVTDFYFAIHPNAMLWNVACGLVGVVLAILGIRLTWPGNWRWIMLLVLTMLIAMGEELRVFGVKTGIPLPYALLADLPGIRASHNPNHIVVISTLLLGLFAAHGCTFLFSRCPQWRGLVAGGLISAIILVDGWTGPMPLVSRPIPQAYNHLPAPDGALLPIPLNINFAKSENLWYQTEHGWPIIGGYTGREPPYHVGKYAPGIRELRYGRRVADDILARDWPELARATLAAYDIRYIIYHPDTMGSSLPRMRTLMDELGFTATYQDATAEIYPVPEVAAPEPLVYLGRGWGGVEQNAERRWRWIGAQAELHLLNPLDEPQVVELELHMESYRQPRPLTLHLDAADLGSIAVSRAAMRRTFRLWLEPGEHVLYLSVPTDPAPDDQGRQLGVAFLGIELHPVQTVEMDRAEMPDEGRDDTE